MYIYIYKQTTDIVYMQYPVAMAEAVYVRWLTCALTDSPILSHDESGSSANPNYWLLLFSNI